MSERVIFILFHEILCKKCNPCVMLQRTSSKDNLKSCWEQKDGESKHDDHGGGKIAEIAGEISCIVSTDDEDPVK